MGGGEMYVSPPLIMQPQPVAPIGIVDGGFTYISSNTNNNNNNNNDNINNSNDNFNYNKYTDFIHNAHVEGRMVSPLPSTLVQARRVLQAKQAIAKVMYQQCVNCTNVIHTVNASREKVVKQMETQANNTTDPNLRETYLRSMQTAHNSFRPGLEVQAKTLAELEKKYTQSLQEVADYETTIQYMEQMQVNQQNSPPKNNNTQLNTTTTTTNNNNNNNVNNNINTNTNMNMNTSINNTSAPDVRLQQLMPHWAEVNARDASPRNFGYYHRCGQGFNFEGWDADERAKMTSVIYETHREADEQYPKLFIDFPAFLSNSTGSGVAFGNGRENFIENINQQIRNGEFTRCLRALGSPEFSHIKAIVITAKKGPLKGNKSIEAQYWGNEMIVLWNDLDNISTTPISFDEFKACLSS